MADDLDLLTLDEGYQAIGDQASAEAHTGPVDDELARMITAISRVIDDICGPVVVRTVTDEQQPGGSDTILVDQYPVQSVTSVTEYSGTTPQVLTAEAFPTTTDYDFTLLSQGKSGLIQRRASGSVSTFPRTGRVLITYVAGRYDSTDEVDAKFKEAASAILRRMWSREAGRWTVGGDPGEPLGGFFRAVQPMVEELLAYEMRGPVFA